MTDSAESVVLIDELVERIRVASFEAPKAGSHTEWKARLAAMFNEFCAFCGTSREHHDGIWHEEDGSSEYVPILVYRPEHSDGSPDA